MPGSLRAVAASAAIALVSAFPTAADAGSYTLEVVVSSGDTVDGRLLSSIEDRGFAINRHGEIAFTARFAGGRGVFTRGSVVAETGQVLDGLTIGSLQGAAIRANGEVLFVASNNGITGVGSSTSSTFLVKSGDTRDGHQLSGSITDVQINDAGQLAFRAAHTGGSSVFVDGQAVGTTGTIIDAHTLTSTFGYDINGSGEIVFTAAAAAGIGTKTGAFTPTGTVAFVGDPIGSGLLTNVADVEIDGAGNMYYLGNATPLGQSVVYDAATSAPILEPGDVIDGHLLGSLGRFIVNDAGTLAFLAQVGGQQVVLTRDSVVAQRLDTVDGLSIAAVRRLELGDGGHIAFYAHFFDGSSGIVVATPSQTVPEPAAATLFALGALGFVARRRRRLASA